ncbi:hypothetical protein Tco_0345433 [Tanacetum coccineum]
MHIFVGNFIYVSDFMIVEDISSIIDPRLSQVVLGKPFIEVSNMTHDLSSGVVRFTNEPEGIAYNMPYKIEQYNSLSDLEKEHTKSVYFRNEEDKRRRVDYLMSKILGFYKECLELGPEYLTGLEDRFWDCQGGLEAYGMWGSFGEEGESDRGTVARGWAEEIAYKMPYKIEQYNSLSDLEKEHTKSIYFRNEEDKRRRVDYVMSKILGFYKECLELGPEYLTGLEDEGGVT